MKFSLPGLLKRKSEAAVARPRKLPEYDASLKPASLVRTRNRLLLAGVILIAALGYFVFQLMAWHVARILDQEHAITTSLVAARMSAMAEYYGASAALLASDPEIAALLEAGEEVRLSAHEKTLRYVFPAAINVRLLPPGISRIDKQAFPPLSYAAITQMRAAENSDVPPPVEVHLFNTPQQHVNIVRRVMNPAGSDVAGHIMLSLSGDVLQQTLDGLQQIRGYIELQQHDEQGEPTVVAKRGDASLKGGEPDRVVTIPGSRWQVAYWPGTSAVPYLGRLGIWALAAAVAAAVLFMLMIVWQFRRLSQSVRLHEISMTMLLKDFRDGHVLQTYPCGLLEMKDTIDFMVQLAAGAQYKARRSSAVREKDADVAEHSPAEPVSEISDQPQGVGDPREGEVADFMAGGTANEGLLLEEQAVEDKGEENMVIDASIFRAYDIRGVVDRTLTAEAVRLIGMAIGSEALQRGRDTIVVGRDGRLSGPVLSAALTEGILATGCNVRDIGCVPTPVLYFATHHLDTQSGVVVTGSHNPPDYNGLKIVIDGETLSGESIQSLRERIEAQNFISGQGSVEHVDVVADYIERIRKDIKLARPLRVAIDCGNGVAGGVAPELLRALGCDVVELYCEVDGNFPNHHPDPSKTENLRDLIAAVTDRQADIGLAFDGDGDRLGVVTSAGGVVWPDRVLMLFARDILERNPGGQIIYDVKCTRFLDGIIREHGGQPLMWKTGHSFIKAKIRESGALLAGEMSGHIFFKERWYGFDDGLYAGARLLEILARDPRSSSEVFAELPDSVNTPELNIPMQEGEPARFINLLLENAHFEDAQVSTIDGLRADFPDGWGLVRSSNTTPVLVLRFEADDDAALQRIKDEFRRVMLQVKPGLELPF